MDGNYPVAAEDLLTPQETLALFPAGTTSKMVYRLANRGELPAVTITAGGRTYRFYPRQAVLDYLPNFAPRHHFGGRRRAA